MGNPFVDKLRGYAALDRVDEDLLEAACQQSRIVPPNIDLIREGDRPNSVFVMLTGWACRYKILPTGGRQIISFMLPGDFCDMHVAVLAEMDHNIGTITKANVATIPRAAMETLVDTRPSLMKAFWWTQLVDAGVLRATIVSMGRRTSLERVSHLLCELYFRMYNIGLANEGPCEMPFTQIVLADAIGLTPVHINRQIGKLRAAGALESRPGSIVITDISRLAQIAGFDDNYLHRRLRRDE